MSVSFFANYISSDIKRGDISKFKQRLMKQYAAETQEELELLLARMMDELGLMYSREKQADFYQIAYIMCELLQYPSQTAAETHCKANRLGTKDLEPQSLIQTEAHRRCPCCGLLLQQSTLDFHANLLESKSIGTSIFYFKMDMIYLVISLMGVFVFFSIFSIVSNLVTSQQYREGTNDALEEDAVKSYVWPLSISFGSQQFFSTSFAQLSVTIQGWLGLFCVALWCFLFITIFRSEMLLGQQVFLQNPTVSSFTFFCQNLPLTYSSNKEQLEKRLNKQAQQYFEKQGIQEKHRRKIRIEKINCAKPYNLLFYELNSLEYFQQQTDRTNILKKKFKEWLNQRRKSSEFSVSEQKRSSEYYLFSQQRKIQYQSYLKVIQEYQNKVQTEIEQQKITHADAFITFDSHESAFVVYDMIESKNRCLDFDPFNQKEHWTWAPEPEDVKWENFGQSNCQIWQRRLVKMFSTIVLLSASFFLLYKSTQFKLYASKNNSNSKDGIIINFLISIGLSTPMYATNFAIKFLFSYLSRNYEKHLTSTNEEISLGNKTLLVMLINSILTPMLINMIYKENVYGVDGLAEDVFYFALTNAILSILLKIFNISFIFNRLGAWYSNWTCKKWKTTQRKLNIDNEYVAFEEGIQYAAMNFSYLYACFYAPLQPIIALISAVGLFFSYKATIVILTKYTKRPLVSNSQVYSEMTKVAYLGPLFFAIGNFCWTDFYASEVHRLRFVNLLIFLLSLLIVALRFKAFEIFQFLQEHSVFQWSKEPNKVEEHQAQTDKNYQKYKQSYQKSKFYFKSEYDRLNPYTKAQAIEKYNLQLKFHKNQLLGDVKNLIIQNYFSGTRLRQIQGIEYNDEVLIMHGQGFALKLK